MSASSPTAQTFKSILETRHACRGFKPDPLPKEVLTSILSDAQRTCSNCNTQPWHVAVVSGEKLKELKAAYITELTTNGLKNTGDFEFDYANFKGVHSERQKAQGKKYYESMGAARDDLSFRGKVMVDNLEMFGAPHAALFFMPDAGNGNVRQAADIGQYAMTLMLSCAAHGVASCPQTVLGMLPDVPRRILGNVPEGYKMLFGVSFGHEDHDAPANQYRMPRAPLEESVVFYE